VEIQPGRDRAFTVEALIESPDARAEARLAPGRTRLAIEDLAVEPWWPNGHGAARTYELEIEVSTDGQVWRRQRTVGVPEEARARILSIVTAFRWSAWLALRQSQAASGCPCRQHERPACQAPPLGGTLGTMLVGVWRTQVGHCGGQCDPSGAQRRFPPSSWTLGRRLPGRGQMDRLPPGPPRRPSSYPRRGLPASGWTT
jgi:hypothetical protein